MLNIKNTEIEIKKYPSNTEIFLEQGEDTYMIRYDHDCETASWDGGYGQPEQKISRNLVKKIAKAGGIPVSTAIACLLG